MSDDGKSRVAVLRRDLQRVMSDQVGFGRPDRLYAELREVDPVSEANGMRVATRFDDVLTGYRDQRFSRHRQAVAEAYAHGAGNAQDETLKLAWEASTAMLINADEPNHKRLRQILEVAFKPTQIKKWASRVQTITDELIANVQGRAEFDFLRELAFLLPERVICELMGVPLEDHGLWGRWTEDIVAAARTHEPSPATMKAVEDAHRNFFLYFRDLVRKRRANMGDDLVSLLIRAESEDDRLSEVELLGTLEMLIEAGHETTGNLIANGMYELLRHPEQYALLRERPDLVDGAVEEMLRYCSPAQWSLPRETVVDVELGGVPIEAGKPVLLSLLAANRDPLLFEQPDSFDIQRNPNRHLAFAGGPHFCLGNQLARTEARIMFRGIMTGLPPLELVEEPQLRDAFVRGYESLRVRVA